MSSLFPRPSPSLTECGSLLIHGKYHTSAPLHLALSHCSLSQQRRALVLTPSREKLKTALEIFNDEWFRSQGCGISAANVAERVKILLVSSALIPGGRLRRFLPRYPPTSAHLILLFGLFHESSPSLREHYSSKSTFDVTPSLLVVCELSSYLVGTPEATFVPWPHLISRLFLLSIISR